MIIQNATLCDDKKQSDTESRLNFVLEFNAYHLSSNMHVQGKINEIVTIGSDNFF